MAVMWYQLELWNLLKGHINEKHGHILSVKI